MREFGKNKKKSFWQKVVAFFSSFTWNSELFSFRGHSDRMKKRRRKSKFDK